MKDEKIVKNCEISAFDGRLSRFRSAMTLLCLLTELEKNEAYSNSKNVVKVYRSELAEALKENGKTVSDRTIKGWLLLLALNGAIKYRYQSYGTGQPNTIFISPLFYFNGSVKEYDETLKRWTTFRSDVAPARQEYVEIIVR